MSDWIPEAAKPQALPDAVGHPLVRLAPARWLPYLQLARIDRPIGWWLLLLPCWQSAALAGVAGGHVPSLLHLVLFWIGAIAMRGAGSTYNDLIDREIDAKVERTKHRPRACGAVTPKAAKIFMVAQALALNCRMVKGMGYSVTVSWLSPWAIAAATPLRV